MSIEAASRLLLTAFCVSACMVPSVRCLAGRAFYRSGEQLAHTVLPRRSSYLCSRVVTPRPYAFSARDRTTTFCGGPMRPTRGETR
jgi:hypothetical protein